MDGYGRVRAVLDGQRTFQVSDSEYRLIVNGLRLLRAKLHGICARARTRASSRSPVTSTCPRCSANGSPS